MEQLAQVSDAHSTPQPPEQSSTTRVNASQTSSATTQAQRDPTALHGIQLIDAVATLGMGRSMVTDVVFGSDNQIAQIRVIDSATHQVIASTPPETMARFEREVMAYQQVARDAKVR